MSVYWCIYKYWMSRKWKFHHKFQLDVECSHKISFKLFRTDLTRSYTADAVWYRQPSGKPTNTVMLNLNWLRVEEVSWQWRVGCVTVPRLSKWYDVTWCDMTWHDGARRDMTCHYMTWHDITWYDMTWHGVHDVIWGKPRGMTWHDVTWHDVTWRKMTWNDVT